MLEIYKIQKAYAQKDAMNNRLLEEQINQEEKKLEDYLLKIKQYIVQNFYDETKKSFVRNKDGRMDISLLGLVYPFKVLTPSEKKVENTPTVQWNYQVSSE